MSRLLHAREERLGIDRSVSGFGNVTAFPDLCQQLPVVVINDRIVLQVVVIIEKLINSLEVGCLSSLSVQNIGNMVRVDIGFGQHLVALFQALNEVVVVPGLPEILQLLANLSSSVFRLLKRLSALSNPLSNSFGIFLLVRLTAEFFELAKFPVVLGCLSRDRLVGLLQPLFKLILFPLSFDEHV